jgi:hypothetical protein
MSEYANAVVFANRQNALSNVNIGIGDNLTPIQTQTSLLASNLT